jgi:hypothetical protein
MHVPVVIDSDRTAVLSSEINRVLILNSQHVAELNNIPVLPAAQTVRLIVSREHFDSSHLHEPFVEHLYPAFVAYNRTKLYFDY